MEFLVDCRGHRTGCPIAPMAKRPSVLPWYSPLPWIVRVTSRSCRLCSASTALLEGEPGLRTKLVFTLLPERRHLGHFVRIFVCKVL